MTHQRAKKVIYSKEMAGIPNFLRLFASKVIKSHVKLNANRAMTCASAVLSHGISAFWSCDRITRETWRNSARCAHDAVITRCLAILVRKLTRKLWESSLGKKNFFPEVQVASYWSSKMKSSKKNPEDWLLGDQIFFKKRWVYSNFLVFCF